LAGIAAIDFNPQVNGMLLKDMEKLNFTPKLSKFCFPTLIMTGRFDMNTAPSGAFKIHKMISGSRFVVFEQSGHFPFYEEQEDFVRLLKEFLSDK
jgi:proline iminopeptidase